MLTSKVYICPLCGNKLQTIWYLNKKINGKNHFEHVEPWCYLCDREIVPLGTPQEQKIFDEYKGEVV